MLESRLEAVERELIRLNKTLQDLITIYVDAQAGGLLQGIPKADNYLPEFIKQRDKLAKHKGKQTLTSMRELIDYAVQVLSVHTVESIISTYLKADETPCTCLADVHPTMYESLYHEINEHLPDEI